MSHIFRFLAQLTGGGDTWQIQDGGEIEHIRRVLKLKPGAAVEVFDGAGRWGAGVISSVSADKIGIEGAVANVEVPLCPAIHVAMGSLKPGETDEVIPVLAELGVEALHVFHQEGTERFRVNEKVAARWHRIAVAAAKQCKSAWLTRVEVYEEFEGFIAAKVARDGGSRFVLTPGTREGLLEALFRENEPLVLVLGGERGLNGEEQRRFEEVGFRPAHLGPHVLRAKTAALAGAAIMSCRRGLR